jgi:hypothetical protein
MADAPNGSGQENTGQANQGTNMGGQGGGGTPNAAFGEMFKGAKDTSLKFISDNGFDKAANPAALLDTIAESYTGLSAKVGNQFTVPKVDASDEDWNKFTGMLRPEKVEDYKFTLPKDLPQNFPYEKESAQAFQTFAHEIGLHPKQAAQMHDWFVTNAAKGFTQSVEQINERVTQAHQALVKEWGNTDSPSYKENVEAGRRAIQNLGGEKLLGEMKQFGMMTENGMIVAPELAKALATAGSILFKEERTVPSTGGQTTGTQEIGGSGTTGANPFKKDSENVTKQGDLLKSNPELAKRLIKEAGLDPKEWQL